MKNDFDQYLKDSIDRIINFFQSNAAVSQTIALETAAAVQVSFYQCISYNIFFTLAMLQREVIVI